MSDNYLLGSELAELMTYITWLNGGVFKEIGLGKTPVYDSSGETVGYVDMCEGGDYAFYPGE